MSFKISIIGAGSAVFSLSMIRDICLTPNLGSPIVSLMDIDEGRLDAAYCLCRRFADEVGSGITIEKTTNRRESIRGASFVINTALVGGHARLWEGWEIAKKYGYRFGGSLHIMHDEAFWVNHYQLKLIEDVCKDILEICPEAWYILVANPVLAGMTYLMRKYPQAKVVGLCQGPMDVYKLTDILGFEREHVEFEASGINHFIWMTRFRYKGEDAFPLLNRYIKDKYGKHAGTKPLDLYQRYGAYPLGDTYSTGGGNWAYWYHSDDNTEKVWQEQPAGDWARHFNHLVDQLSLIKKAAYDLSVKVTDVFPAKHSEESIIPLVESIVCDIPRTMIVNIFNDQCVVPGVPADFEVELPAEVSKSGIRAIKTEPLSKPIIAHLLRDRIAPVEMELQAFEEGNINYLISLVMMDPWTKSEKQAIMLIEDILALPCHGEMRKHYNV